MKTNKKDQFVPKKFILDFPLSCPKTHTMGSNLTKWAWSKVPKEDIEYCYLNDINIEVHGIYPDNILSIIDCDSVEYLNFTPTSVKNLNFVRPKFAFTKNKKKMIVAVTPGKDYIYHYSGILRYCLNLFQKQNLLKIYRYPHIEKNICSWTSLDKKFILKNSIVIIGFIEEARSYITRNYPHAQLLEKNENEFYISYKYLIDKKLNLTFLGVKYSFWGNISKKIIEYICSFEAKEIIYIGKLGSLNSKNDIYKKIFSPTKYVTLNYLSIRDRTEDLQNNIVRYFPELNTNLHISVPTVVGEDLKQRDLAVKIGGSSIDNEISQMANSISSFNNSHKTKISFSCLHFASDYLRSYEELNLEIEYDLSNNREVKTLEQKMKIMNEALGYFKKYFKKLLNSET